MANSLAGVLASIPGYGGYVAQRQLNEGQESQQLQQMGALQKIAAQQQAQQQEAAYRQAIGGLGPNATEEQVLQASRPFMGAEAGAKLASGSLDRKAALQDRAMQFAQTIRQRQDDLDRKRDEFMQKTEDTKAKMLFEQWYKSESLKNSQANTNLNAELKMMGLDIQRQGLEAQKDKAKLGAEQAQDKNVQAFGTALERVNITESNAVLKAAEEMLSKDPKLAEWISGPKAMVPDLVAPKNVTDARQSFQKLFNITLKDRSGAAVTNPEFERLKAEFASGAWKKPEQLMEGLKQARNVVNEHYRGLTAGFNPNTVKTYNENLSRSGGQPIMEDKPDPLGIRK